MRKRKGVTQIDARDHAAATPINYGMMMVHAGDADGLVAGLTQHYPETIRPALQIIKPRPGISTVAGLYMLVFKNDVRFITDATVNFDPTAGAAGGHRDPGGGKGAELRHRAAHRDAVVQQLRQHAAPVGAEDGPGGGAREAPRTRRSWWTAR